MFLALKSTPAQARRTRTPLFRREPINPGEVLVEIFAVVLGVLIALAIDRWRENMQAQATVDSAVRSIRNELAGNRKEAQAQAEHLSAMASRMQEANSDVSEQRSCMGYEGWAGLQSPMLLDTAYEVAVATGALAKMPYEQAGQVGAAYGAQRYVKDLQDQAATFLLAEQERPLGLCVTVAREVARSSAQLADRYAKTLAALPESVKP